VKIIMEAYGIKLLLLMVTGTFLLSACNSGSMKKGAAELDNAASKQLFTPEPAHTVKKPEDIENQGRYIKDIYTDKGSYKPSRKVVITLVLHNPDTNPLEGSINLKIKRLDETVYETNKDFSLEVDRNSEVDFTWKAPEDDFTGYAVEVCLYSGENLLDYEMTAIDVSSDWNVFPRFAYLTDMGRRSYEESERIIRNLSKFHINGLFYYDVMDRHDKPLAGTAENPEPKWNTIANALVDANTLKDMIDIGHNYNMKSFFYNLIFGGYSTYEEIGVKKEWGLFKDKNHSVQDCHPLPESWESSIYLFNPANKGWQDHFLKAHKEFLSVYDFDGLQVDSLGNRGQLYDYDGNPIKLDDTYASLLKRIPKELNTRVIFNAVDQYGQYQVASEVDYDILYAEIWPHKARTYNALKGIVDSMHRMSEGKRGIVIAAYMNYQKAKSGGKFNTPGVNFTNATLLAAGGSHLEIGDLGMLSSEYYPARHLEMDYDLQKSIRNYYSFMTAYENVLRGSGFEEISTATYVDGELTSYDGRAGKIWSFTKVKKPENFEIIHFINLKGASHSEWVDDYGTQTKPVALKNIKVRQYTAANVNKVFIASPDYCEGFLRQVEFKKGSDDKGEYIEFSLPYLEYWTMAILK